MQHAEHPPGDGPSRSVRLRGWLGGRWALVRLGVLALVLSGIMAYMMWMPGSSYDGPRVALDDDQQALAGRLQEHVQVLASQIGQRNVLTAESLELSAQYIEDEFQGMGYTPERQTYEAHDQQVANVIVEVPGAALADEIVVIGAHYDTVQGSPGANDNASGLAALLELARRMHDHRPARTVRFVSFVNEEPPFFKEPEMGSHVYAQRARERGDHIIAMMSMDGIGYYSDELSSQDYPVPGIDLLYPTTGDFVAFVTRTRDASLLRQAIGTFREHAKVPSEGAALPGQIEGVGFSDHWAFWQHGYSSFLVTDTLPFRDPHYHSAADTPDRLDYERMALVVEGLDAVVRELAEE